MVYVVRWTVKQRDQFVRRWLRFREKNGLTQLQMAEALAVSTRTVQRVERGKFVPREETVNRFAEMERRHKEGEQVERELAWVPGETGEI